MFSSFLHLIARMNCYMLGSLYFFFWLAKHLIIAIYIRNVIKYKNCPFCECSFIENCRPLVCIRRVQYQHKIWLHIRHERIILNFNYMNPTNNFTSYVDFSQTYSKSSEYIWIYYTKNSIQFPERSDIQSESSIQNRFREVSRFPSS